MKRQGDLEQLYGTALTIMFTVLPLLGVVGGSPTVNVEPSLRRR